MSIRPITAEEIRMVQSWFSDKGLRARATGIRVFQQLRADNPDWTYDQLKPEVKKIVTGE